MKTKTIQIREGELLGPVDWDYDFSSHDWDHGGGTHPEAVKRGYELLKTLSEPNKKFKAVIYDDSPKPVIAIGMYDGWPHWKPVPSVLLATSLGHEWHDFTRLKRIEMIEISNDKTK